MFPLYRSTLTMVLTAACCFMAQAQSDSTYLDLGRTMLRSDHVQGITLRGEDLKRIPYTSLHEVLNVWFHGAFTSRVHTTYVVDGLVALDPNTISIEDIAEITLVQNALAQLNGASGQQQLVLITTRKTGNPEASVTVTGQSGLTRAIYSMLSEQESSTSRTNVYHQYGINARQSFKKISLGVSLGWQRDVFPAKKDSLTTYLGPEGPVFERVEINTKRPYNFDRFRAGAFMHAHLSDNHSLQATAAYIAQFTDREKQFSHSYQWGLGEHQEHRKFNDQLDGKASQLQLSMNLRSSFGSILQNEFKAAYVKGDIDDSRAYNYTNIVTTVLHANTRQEDSNLVLANTLSATTDIGNWSLVPSINLMARRISERTETEQSSRTIFVADIPEQGGWSRSGYKTSAEGKAYTITPALNLYYKKAFNLMGGLVYNASPELPDRVEKVLPFVSLSADVIKLVKEQGKTGLKLWGSYAKAENYGDKASLLPALLSPDMKPGTMLPTYMFVLANPDLPKLYSLQGGGVFSLLQEKLTLSYHFGEQRTQAWFFVRIPSELGYGSYYYMDVVKSASQRIGLAYWLKESTSGINIRTQLQASFIRNEHEEWATPPISEVLGNQDAETKPWSLGWANRIALKRFSAGVDLLASFDQTLHQKVRWGGYEVIDQHYNTLAIQNLYVAYHLQNTGFSKATELFVSARNITLNGKPNLQEIRSYYGLGFRVEL